MRPAELFHRWYVAPLRALQELPNGDGGFVALAISCSLYERYAMAVLKKRGKKRISRSDKVSQFARDCGVDEEIATAFWYVIRDGLAHAAMPKQLERGNNNLPWYVLRHDLPMISLEEQNGEAVLLIQPWLFMERVLELWHENLDLLAADDNFPWAGIFPVAL